ncbi:MAG: radical SAM protein [Chloroflexi bacterium]|nr:radical SAM protein [Chloroflexota bacterium]
MARGRQRSRPAREILEEVLIRQNQGYQEIVLTGVHIGAYGSDSGQTLADLVRTILDETNFPRLRLTSIEPWDLSPELLQLWGDPRMCRHLHLPLQSGCDATLQRMNRRYTTGQYRALVERARAAIPDVAVTTDVIVGFPDEDEREFAVSAEFVTGIGFARIHVFPFSARPGTAALAMPAQVLPQVKKMRMRHMSAIALHSSAAFHCRFVGRTVGVLFESKEGGHWNGLTDNYMRVRVDSPDDLTNHILSVRLLEATAEDLKGELMNERPSLEA